MDTATLINIFLAFLEGFALILSPCILPLLPILLAGSLEGSKKRPLGIILGFIVVFAVFSFFAKKIVQVSGIDLNIIRTISYTLLMLLGIIMISNTLTEKFSQGMQWLTKSLPIPTSGPENGFLSGVFFGGLLGLVWTPCAGPILAAVIVQTVLQQTTMASFFTFLAFGIGVSIPMLIIIFLSRSILDKFKFFKQRSVLIRKILGLLIVIGVILMIYADRIILLLSNETPKTTTEIKTSATRKITVTGLVNGLSRPYPAPPLEDIAFWINTQAIELSALKGKVVLIDFWAYSCINCIRTLPYLKNWDQKYRDKGLVIIGVHTPEFDFERDINNVRKSVKDYGINYPVVLDNNFSTWRNYLNRYWPATYLIDKKGQVVYTHFGEGNYAITEENIRVLLGLPARETEEKAKTKIEEDSQNKNDQNSFLMQQTPETYLGYERSNAFVSPEAMSMNYNKDQEYSYPVTLPENSWALKGNWTVFQKNILANTANAALKIHFTAKKVYAVMGSKGGKDILVKLFLDSTNLTSEIGKSVKDGKIIVNDFKLYEIIDLKRTESGILELIATEPGLEIFTFTFGGA